MIRIATLAMLLAATAACASTGSEPLTGSWQLSLGQVDGGPLTLVDGWPISLEFDEGQLGGTAACNSYSGAFARQGDMLTVSELASTEMACSPSPVMDSESAYLSALDRVTTVTIDDDVLTMTGEGLTLTFQAVDSASDNES